MKQDGYGQTRNPLGSRGVIEKVKHDLIACNQFSVQSRVAASGPRFWRTRNTRAKARGYGVYFTDFQAKCLHRLVAAGFSPRVSGSPKAWARRRYEAKDGENSDGTTDPIVTTASPPTRRFDG